MSYPGAMDQAQKYANIEGKKALRLQTAKMRENVSACGLTRTDWDTGKDGVTVHKIGDYLVVERDGFGWFIAHMSSVAFATVADPTRELPPQAN